MFQEIPIRKKIKLWIPKQGSLYKSTKYDGEDLVCWMRVGSFVEISTVGIWIQDALYVDKVETFIMEDILYIEETSGKRPKFKTFGFDAYQIEIILSNNADVIRLSEKDLKKRNKKKRPIRTAF